MERFYNLSFAQQNIWNVENFISNTSINNIAATLKFSEEIDLFLLEKAVNLVLKKNDALRIKVTIINNEPVQYIDSYEYYQLDCIDLRNYDDPQKPSILLKSLTETPFQILDSPLYYGAIIRVKNAVYFYFKQHHLIADAWSVILTGDRILNYYLKLKNSENIDEIEEFSYIDSLISEEEYLNSKRFLNNQNFWKKQTEINPEFIYLKNRPKQYSTKAERWSVILPAETSAMITDFCKENNLSILVIYTSILAVYINRIFSKKNIVLGTTVLNRLNNKDKNTLGMYINVIPIILQIKNDDGFITFLKYVLSVWKSYLLNSHYPHDFIFKEYREKFKNDDLFDIGITYQNATHHFPIEFETVESTWYPCGHQLNSLNIHINDRNNSNQYQIDYDYLVDLFTAEEIEKLHYALINLLQDALQNPNKTISALELLTYEEKRKLLFEFSQTSQAELPATTLSQLFEQQAALNPDGVAIIYQDMKVTYRELNEKANYVAWLLREKGVKPDSVVGLCMERSIEMYIGILGVLKAGAAYLPIDPAFPRKRFPFILRGSACKVLLTAGLLLSCSWGGEILNIKMALSREALVTVPADELTRRSTNPPQTAGPANLAYIIYTSGSTGKPKGVMIEHRSIVNTITWRKKFYNFGKDDVLLQIPPYSFDSSVEDIFTFFAVGGTIVTIEQEKRLDLVYLGQLITKYQVTHFLATPMFYNTMLDDLGSELGSLKKVTVAGESIPLNVVKKHFQMLPHVELYNEYGPTENSVCSTVHRFHPEDEVVLIGKPIDNCQCYVLSETQDILPIGAVGELYLGGPGLARGYINQPELTSKKFAFIPQVGAYLYRTGDLVKWNDDCELQFIARIDNQVKIRGFRIELAEIENQLLKYPLIKETVVVANEDESGSKYLCAYIVADSNLQIPKLKDYLAKSLPEYMIPNYFVRLDQIPLTVNGKIDKKELPPPEIIPSAGYEEPQNEVEKTLVNIWKQVLEIDKIGINDDFFELGGDSLAVIRVLTMCYSYNWNLKAQDFYRFKTVKQLADYILNPGPAVAVDSRSLLNLPQRINVVDLSFFSRQLKRHGKRRIKNVLLTGVTGYLGMHLLAELLQLKDIKVYTLVRGDNQESAKSRLFRLLTIYYPQLDLKLMNRRVTVINGDIAAKQFGLSETDYQQLFQNIDTVIHSAALVKHFGEYQDFQRINIAGTQNICQFSKGKFLTHISTTSVSGDYCERNRGLKFDESCFDIGQQFDGNYYVQSKFEAEKVIIRHFNEGFDGTIIRVGNLTGRYLDGIFQLNIAENKFYQILKTIISLSVVPESLLATELEFTPVDLCSKAIVKIIKRQDCSNRTYHLFNHNFIKMSEFISILKELGYKLTVVNDQHFYKQVQALSANKDDRDVLFGIITDLNQGKLCYDSYVKVDSQITVNYLNRLRFNWPTIDVDYIKKVFEHMEAVQFIKKGISNFNNMGG